MPSLYACRSTLRLLPCLMLLLVLLAGCDVLTEPAGRPADAALPAATPAAEADFSATLAASVECWAGTHADNALFQICVPEPWNGDLVLYAHGYVAPGEPLRLPSEAEQVIPLVTSLGYAFATSSFSKNGLAIREGLDDLLDLQRLFAESSYGAPRRTFITGASEGGLIAALAVERYPDRFNGGEPVCGPIGDFRKQLNYFGDFLVLFNYFFPELDLPGPDEPDALARLQPAWETQLVPAIAAALQTKPDATRQLLQVTRAPFDPADPTTIGETVLGVLWYSVFATQDAVAVLGGNPYGNRGRFYFGSDNDLRLNLRLPRYTANRAALAEIERFYQTSGDLKRPLVTLHTNGDPIVPIWHQLLYRLKAYHSGSWLLYSGLPIDRYGHCTFEDSELLAGFALLILKATGQELVHAELALTDEKARADFRQTARALRRPQTVPTQADLQHIGSL